MSRLVRIATRGSKLALWQSEFVASQLRLMGLKTELVILSTLGDRVQDRFLFEMGGKGLFVKELEQALLEGKADIAVHSSKDLPAVLKDPFALAAVLPRHTARDVMIFHPEAAARLKPPALIQPDHLRSWRPLKVATASLRRQSLIKSVAPEIQLFPIRGNVDTRIAKLHGGEWDAIILAEAGLMRLGIADVAARSLDPSWFVPSPAQGALVVEARTDSPFYKVVARLDHQPSRVCVEFERSVLAALGGDCSMPIGCHMFFDTEKEETVCRIVVLNHKGEKAQTTITVPGDPRWIYRLKTLNLALEGLKENGLDQILKDIADAKPQLGELKE